MSAVDHFRRVEGLSTLVIGVAVLSVSLLAAGTYCVFCIAPGVVAAG